MAMTLWFIATVSFTVAILPTLVGIVQIAPWFRIGRVSHGATVVISRIRLIADTMRVIAIPPLTFDAAT